MTKDAFIKEVRDAEAMLYHISKSILKNIRETTLVTVKEAVEQSTVFKKKVTKVFINSKSTMAVLDINKFKRHGSSAFHGILVSAGSAETASRNWLM